MPQHDGRSTVIAPRHRTTPTHGHARTNDMADTTHTRDALLSSSVGAMASPSPYNTLSSLYHTLQYNSTRNRLYNLNDRNRTTQQTGLSP